VDDAPFAAACLQDATLCTEPEVAAVITVERPILAHEEAIHRPSAGFRFLQQICYQVQKAARAVPRFRFGSRHQVHDGRHNVGR
jgi:hypothetical protein